MSSEPPCCSSRAKGRPAGAASSRLRKQARSPSGSRSDERRAPAAEAARGGDEDAFAGLVEPYQPRAARALLPDARLLPRRRGRAAGDAAPRLARTRTLRGAQLAPLLALPDRHQPCLRDRAAARSACCRSTTGRPPTRTTALGEPLTESVWLEPYPDAELGLEAALLGPEARYEQRESVELAFTAALQHLPARQRAVLILRDVLGFSAEETAEALDTTPVVGRQRAAASPQDGRRARSPTESQQETLRALGDDELARSCSATSDAWERNDVDAVVAMLAEDARLAMPPCRTGTAAATRSRPSSAAGRSRRASAGGSSRRAQTATRLRRLPVGRARRELSHPRRHRAHAPRPGDRGDHRLPRSRSATAVRPARVDRLGVDPRLSTSRSSPNRTLVVRPPGLRETRRKLAVAPRWQPA